MKYTVITFQVAVVATLFCSATLVAAGPQPSQHELLSRLPRFSVTSVRAHLSSSSVTLAAANDAASSVTSRLSALEHVELQLELPNNRSVTLNLHRNRNLFAPGYSERKAENGHMNASKPDLSKHCHYQGVVVNISNSFAAISLCQGVSGIIGINGELFVVEPLTEQSRALFKLHQASTVRSRLQSVNGVPTSSSAISVDGDHLVYPFADLEQASSSPSLCGTGEHVHPPRPADSATEAEEQVRPVSAGHQEGQSQPSAEPLTAGSTAYVEALIVNDNLRFSQFGLNTESMSAGVFNMMQAMYRSGAFSVIINLVLVGQVTWTGPDPYAPTMAGSEAVLLSSATSNGLLDLFNTWRTRTSLVAHDSALLFSGYDFQGQTVGLAYVGTMCWSAYSGSIVQATSSSSAVVAAIAAHEIGHTLSAQHDSVGNACPSSGYIMNAVLTSPPSQWSTCSVSTISTFLTGAQAFCLANVPTIAVDPSSGTAAPTTSPATRPPVTTAPPTTQPPTTQPPTTIPPTTIPPITIAPTTQAAPTILAPSSSYFWATTQCSPCTKSCGGGICVRSVYCQSSVTRTAVVDTLCAGLKKPSSVLTCNMGPCPLVTNGQSAVLAAEMESHTQTSAVSTEQHAAQNFAATVQSSSSYLTSSNTKNKNNSNSAGWSPLAWITVGWLSMLMAVGVWQFNMRSLGSMVGCDSVDTPQTQTLLNQTGGSSIVPRRLTVPVPHAYRGGSALGTLAGDNVSSSSSLAFTTSTAASSLLAHQTELHRRTRSASSELTTQSQAFQARNDSAEGHARQSSRFALDM